VGIPLRIISCVAVDALNPSSLHIPHVANNLCTLFDLPPVDVVSRCKDSFKRDLWINFVLPWRCVPVLETIECLHGEAAGIAFHSTAVEGI